MTAQELRGHRVVRAVAPWVGIVIGGIATAFGYATLIMPNDMLEGGVTGLGMMANRAFGLPAGLSGLALTAIIFVFGVRTLGKVFGVKAILGTLVVSLSMDFFHSVLHLPALTDDKMLAAFYGGALCGGGLGLVYLCGAATGGGDTLAQILRRTLGYPVARTILVIDAVVMGGALLLYGAEQVMYSLLMIFVQTKVIDLVLHGSQANLRLLIVSDRADAIRKVVLHEIGRGLTVFRGRGGFTDTERDVLMTVVGKKQLPQLRRAISETDPHAFVVVEDVHQCYGEGFDRLPLPSKAPAVKAADTEREAPVAPAPDGPLPVPPVIAG